MPRPLSNPLIRRLLVSAVVLLASSALAGPLAVSFQAHAPSKAPTVYSANR